MLVVNYRSTMKNIFDAILPVSSRRLRCARLYASPCNRRGSLPSRFVAAWQHLEETPSPLSAKLRGVDLLVVQSASLWGRIRLATPPADLRAGIFCIRSWQKSDVARRLSILDQRPDCCWGIPRPHSWQRHGWQQRQQMRRQLEYLTGPSNNGKGHGIIVVSAFG